MYGSILVMFYILFHWIILGLLEYLNQVQSQLSILENQELISDILVTIIIFFIVFMSYIFLMLIFLKISYYEEEEEEEEEKTDEENRYDLLN